jgi:hypothetical protein
VCPHTSYSSPNWERPAYVNKVDAFFCMPLVPPPWLRRSPHTYSTSTPIVEGANLPCRLCTRGTYSHLIQMEQDGILHGLPSSCSGCDGSLNGAWWIKVLAQNAMFNQASSQEAPSPNNPPGNSTFRRLLTDGKEGSSYSYTQGIVYSEHKMTSFPLQESM